MAYLPLSTANLPNPGIDPAQNKLPAKYFDTFLYTGNGSGLQVGDVIKKPADTTTIAQSVYMDDGTYLDSGSITAATDAERRKWAWSGWVKRNSSGAMYLLNQTDRDGTGPELSYTLLGANADDNGAIIFADRPASANDYHLTSTRKLLPDGMWHHLLFHKDSTTEANNKLWIDGVEENLTKVGTFVTNQLSSLGSATGGTSYNTMRYGRFRFAGTDYDYADYYLAEVHFIQGSLPSISTFGEFDANGIWIPKAVTGLTYGTHGHYLTFADNTSFGDDTSGNTFDFTGTNFATTDQVDDSPTDNCALHLDPSTATTHTISEGNLKTTNTSGTHGGAVCNRAYFSGKWYHEVKILAETSDKGQGVGIGNRVTRSTTDWGNYVGLIAYLSDGTVLTSGGYSAFGNAHNTNDIIGVAYDHDARTLEFFHNGSSQGTLTESDFPSTIDWDNIAPLAFGRNVTQEFNFGQRTFYGTDGAGTLPTGYLAPTENNITVDETNMESPDFVWIKNRSAGDSHQVYDSVRGVQKVLLSDPDSPPAEADAPNGLLDFNANGFTIGSQNEVNTSGENYVAWTWKAGGTPSTIAAGSISTSPDVPSIASSVSANTESGFSIVSYTGTDSATETIGHGLTQAPEMIIVMKLSSSPSFYPVYHKDTGNTKLLRLNTTDGTITSSVYWNNTTPTSTVFTVGTSSALNDANDFIAFCFHSVDGFSKVGSYIGNGSPDGPFVYLGFRPKFWMMKSADDATHWVIYDSERETYNDVQDQLLPNELNAETASGRPVDFLSNGVKLRFSSYLNDSTQTYIYMAFAENPFKYSNAR